MLRAALTAHSSAGIEASRAELQALPSRMILCDDYWDEKHLRYFHFTVGETVEMSWGKKSDGSNLAWLGCGSAPPKRRTITGVAPGRVMFGAIPALLTVHTDRGDVDIRTVGTAERWQTALKAVLQAAGLRAVMGDAAVESLAAAGCRTAEHVLQSERWYKHDGAAPFGESGVMYGIGTKGKTVPWSNPCASGEVACAWSSFDTECVDKVENFVSRPPEKPNRSLTDDKLNSRMAVDLGPWSLTTPCGTALWEGMGGRRATGSCKERRPWKESGRRCADTTTMSRWMRQRATRKHRGRWRAETVCHSAAFACYSMARTRPTTTSCAAPASSCTACRVPADWRTLTFPDELPEAAWLRRVLDFCHTIICPALRASYRFYALCLFSFSLSCVAELLYITGDKLARWKRIQSKTAGTRGTRSR